MCHVLVIEDDALIALYLESVLSEHGATTFDFADTEKAAIEAARRLAPAFITSDVTLREGSGPRAVAAILKETGPVPVLFITATPDRCVPCEPPARIFSKPVVEGALIEAFRSLSPARPEAG